MHVLTLATFCFVVGIFYFVFMARFLSFADHRVAARQGALRRAMDTRRAGQWHSFIEQFTYFGYLLPPLTAVMYMKSRSFLNVKSVYCVLLSRIFWCFPRKAGAERNIGATLGSAVLVGVLLSRRKLRTIHVVMMLGALFAVQVAMNIIVQNRGSGYGEFGCREWTFARIRVDDNFNRLAQTADFVPAYFPYSGLQFVVFYAGAGRYRERCGPENRSIRGSPCRRRSARRIHP